MRWCRSSRPGRVSLVAAAAALCAGITGAGMLGAALFAAAPRAGEIHGRPGR